MIHKIKTELKWGVIFILASLVWMLMERLVGLHDIYIDKHATYTNLFAIIAIAVYFFALKDKRDHDLGGKMTWKEGFTSGAIISIIVGLLSPLGQWVTIYVITPGYFANAINYGVTNGLTTQADAEAYFNIKNYIFISTMSAPLMGLVTSAVVAFFMKSKAEVVDP